MLIFPYDLFKFSNSELTGICGARKTIIVYIVKLENRCLINCGILAIICLDISKKRTHLMVLI